MMNHALLFAALLFSGGSDSVHGTAELSNGHAAGNAVIYLEGETKASPMADAMVDQRERTFIPHVSVITSGTTVRFPNNDTIFHNVFADYNAKKFDLGRYARGQTKRQKFDKTGVVALMCSVHPDMIAYILVVDTPYYAVTDSKGHFKIDNVPAGSYTLHAWHENGESENRKITVSSGADLQVRIHR
jgi:plastocyanin